MALKRVLSYNRNMQLSLNRFQKLNHSTIQSPDTNDNPSTFAERYASRCNVTGKVKLMVGDYTTANKVFTPADIQTYAEITGDSNPVHSTTNNGAAQEVGFNESVCHGMFTGALFSTAVGSNFPGAILVEKTLKWKKPLYINEALHAHVQVTRVLQGKKLVLCDLSAKNQKDELVIEGKCTMLIRDLDDNNNE